MANIHIRTYSDGFYALSAQVNGRMVAVKYSDTTDRDEAIKDFENVIKEEQEKCRTQ